MFLALTFLDGESEDPSYEALQWLFRISLQIGNHADVQPRVYLCAPSHPYHSLYQCPMCLGKGFTFLALHQAGSGPLRQAAAWLHRRSGRGGRAPSGRATWVSAWGH